MLKLLLILVTFLGVGLALLGLRQYRWELNSQSVKLYSEIRARQETILANNLEIARQTNPWALATALKNSGVNPGGALERRGTQVNKPLPAIETDLVAPLRQ